jgi:hypothetical protein
MYQLWVGIQHGIHKCTERALVLPYIHFSFFKLGEFLADNSRGCNWVLGGHSIMIQYCLEVLFLGEGDSVHVSVIDNLYIEDPICFSEVSGRKDGSNLSFEKDDNANELVEHEYIINIYYYKEEVITFSSGNTVSHLIPDLDM